MQQRPHATGPQWPPAPDLVERARAGDTKAIDDLYRAIRPRLRSFFIYQGFAQATYEDLTASIMEKVIRKLRTLRKPRAFEAWFWALTRNHVRGHFRRQKRDRVLSELPGPSPTQPPETVLLAEEHQAVRAALATLSPADRELLWLREVEGLSYRDLGGRLGAASGAVRVRCHRARQRLQDAYETTLDGKPNEGHE
jgi:RNA polymerase sigma factor (sigma-70 family)